MTLDGKHVVLNCDENVFVWDMKEGDLLTFLKNMGNLIAISSDGWRAICMVESLLVVWDLATGERLHTIGGINTPNDCIRAHDNRATITLTNDLDAGASVFRMGSHMAKVHLGQDLHSWVLGSDGESLFAGGRLGGVFFLHMENAPKRQTPRCRFPHKAALRCPSCGQWESLAGSDLQRSNGNGRASCGNCRRMLTVSAPIMEGLSFLDDRGDETTRFIPHPYPSGFWFQSTGGGMGGYSGICRLCGGSDSDPGSPPVKCPGCGWSR